MTAPAWPAASLRRLLLTTAVFATLDFVWLSLLMADFYKRQLGSLARRSGADFAPVWWAAVLVYVVLVVGLVTFVLPKARTVAGGFAWGALFGIVTYGTYDLTCQAVLRDWPVTMTVVDIAWGATLCGLTCASVLAIEQRLRPFTLPSGAAE